MDKYPNIRKSAEPILDQLLRHSDTFWIPHIDDEQMMVFQHPDYGNIVAAGVSEQALQQIPLPPGVTLPPAKELTAEAIGGLLVWVLGGIPDHPPAPFQAIAILLENGQQRFFGLDPRG